MKTTTSYLPVFMIAIALTGMGAAHGNNDTHHNLGDDVQAFSFSMQGLPAPAAGEEVDSEKEIETDPDNNDSVGITEEEAVQIALEELGSNEWNLTGADLDEGIYSLEFSAGESEAEVEVDASSKKVVELEGEVEYEPREEAQIRLKGFIRFNHTGKVIDVESESEDGETEFTVSIGTENASGEMRTIRESVDVDPGAQSASLEVLRDGETVYTDQKRFDIPSTGKESEDEEDESERLENMSREELIEEVKDLRRQVEDLKARISGDDSQGPPEEVRDKRPSEGSSGTAPVEPDEENEDSSVVNKSGETEDGGNGSSGEDVQGPQNNPGSENRPGFVNNLLRGLFS